MRRVLFGIVFPLLAACGTVPLAEDSTLGFRPLFLRKKVRLRDGAVAEFNLLFAQLVYGCGLTRPVRLG